MSGWPDLESAPPELRSLLRRIDHPRTRPRSRRELCHQALALLRWDQRRLWVLLQIELGSDWIEDPDADPIVKVERAIHAYETALAFPDLTPESRAAAHSNAGFCYLHRVRGLRMRNLDAAQSSGSSSGARIASAALRWDMAAYTRGLSDAVGRSADEPRQCVLPKNPRRCRRQCGRSVAR